MIIERRKFLIGAAASLIAAPAIVRAASLMPVKAMPAVADLEALLKQRIIEAQVAVVKNMTWCLYGDPARPSIVKLTAADDNQTAALWPYQKIQYETSFIKPGVYIDA